MLIIALKVLGWTSTRIYLDQDLTAVEPKGGGMGMGWTHPRLAIL